MVDNIDQSAEAVREQCMSSLLDFTKVCFQRKGTNRPFIPNWHHEVVCHYLEQVVAGNIKRLIINIPPRYGKTELAIVNFIGWAMGLFPEAQFIHVSYSHQLVERNGTQIRDLMESEYYRAIFPHVKFRKDTHSKTNLAITSGGAIYGAGLDGTLTGMGAGLNLVKTAGERNFGGAMVIDDPLKANDAMSVIQRQKVIHAFNDTLMSRLACEDTPVILIMQRLHTEDLAGYLLEQGGWTHIKIPVLLDNKALWVHKHKIKDIKDIQSRDKYGYNTQYMQEPTFSRDGGELFKTSWWQYYNELPKCTRYIITGDTAMKTKEVNDYSVFQFWGVYKAEYFLIAQRRGKWEASDLKNTLKTFYNECLYIATSVTIHVEDKASGTGLIQDLRREGLPIRGIQRNIDKITRAYNTQIFMENRRVFLPTGKYWLDDYIDEFSQFTKLNTHKHDDQIDCTMDAIEILKPKGNRVTWGVPIQELQDRR